MSKDDLSEIAKEIQEYIKNEGFELFYTKPDLDNDANFEWDDDQDWKGFFRIAKKEGVTTVIGTISTLTKNMIEELSEIETEAERNDGENEELRIVKELVTKLSSHSNKIGHYNFRWIKDGLEYSLTDTTDWFEELIEITRQFDREQKRSELVRRPSLIGYSGISSERPVPKALEGKTEDELAKELLDYVMSESGGKLTTREFRTLAFMFWNKLGTSRVGLPGEYAYLIQKAEMKVEKQIEIMQLEREKKELPKLVDECYEWCKKNNLAKIIKTNVSAFLAEKEISLSKNGQDMLYQQVNMKLRTFR